MLDKQFSERLYCAPPQGSLQLPFSLKVKVRVEKALTGQFITNHLHGKVLVIREIQPFFIQAENRRFNGKFLIVAGSGKVHGLGATSELRLDHDIATQSKQNLMELQFKVRAHEVTEVPVL